MKIKTAKRIHIRPVVLAALLLTVLLSAIVLVGCSKTPNGETDGTTTPSAGDNTSAPAELVTLFKDGRTDYRIIWPSRPADPEFNAYVAIQKAFGVCGVKITGDRDSTEPTELEILIGETSREESQSALKGLRDSDYVIRMMGKKLVIVGGSAEATYKAATQFISEFAASDTTVLALPEDLSSSHSEQYPVMSMKINDVDISEFSIVIHYPTTHLTKYAAERLSSAISTLTGYTLKVTNDSHDKSGHEIILGQTSRAQSSVADDEYSVHFGDGNLYIEGGTSALMTAVNGFIDEHLPESAEGELSLDISTTEQKRSATLTYPPEQTLDGRRVVALCDQKNASLVMIDLDAADPTSPEAVVWTWRPTATLGFTSTSTYGNRIDEAILRYSELHGTYVVCVTSSSGYMCVAEYPSGKCLWEASAKGYGPHSIDYLPNGNVAVVCSGNNDYTKGCVRVYAASSGIRSTKCASKLISGAHGVLWDDDYQVLWVLGNETLCAFRVTGTAAAPKLEEVTTLCQHSGITGGHSLSVCPSDPDQLWITGSTVWTFKKSTGALTTEVPGASTITTGGVKSHDSFADGTIIQAVATGVYAAHDTDTLCVYRTEDGGKTYTRTSYVFANRAFYKARRVAAPYT